MTDQNTDIDFNQIMPRLGGKREAFEELVCQLARRSVGGELQRLHGDGGDGGIECYQDTSAGRCGWQAKYVNKIDPLIRQATNSLKTALQVHPTLTRFVLCFPFDLTGPTARRGKSGTQKAYDWKVQQEEEALKDGRQLTIELWPASTLRSLILEHDVSGGLRHFFFGTTSLSDGWFSDHLDRAFATAGPRYTPEINVDTDLYRWIGAFGRQQTWVKAPASHLAQVRRAEKRFGYVLPPRKDRDPSWPGQTLETTQALLVRMRALVSCLEDPATVTGAQHDELFVELSALVNELRSVEDDLVLDIEAQHGEGRADSPGWRQYMAEYMVSFPAAHLDAVRDLIEAVDSLAQWVNSPEWALAFGDVLVLDGDPGTGKTHGICDAGKRRHGHGLRTCIIFGHEFNDSPDPWSRVAESLGFPSSLGTDRLLDCLNSAGEASGYPLVLCVDAINETKPRTYWKARIAAMAQSVRTRPFIRLCLVCKTTYLPLCVPERGDFLRATHRGFANIEREACQAYFSHFGLRPPIAPVLQPELSNPLYLRLVCETLAHAGLDRLPAGWSGGGTAIIGDFLNQRASVFAEEFETSPPHVSTTCLMKIVSANAQGGTATVAWETARELIRSDVHDPDAVLKWLVSETLLVEDAAPTRRWEQRIVLRPAFERLGDFLIATEILDRVRDYDLLSAARHGGPVYPWLKDRDAIQNNAGVLHELAALIPERTPGLELPDLANDSSTFDHLSLIAIRAIPFRAPFSLAASTRQMVRRGLGHGEFAFETMDSVLACCWRRSSVDAYWLHDLLSTLPMVKRDAFWCAYLLESFEAGGVVSKLIEAADELGLDDIEPELADRWVTALLWSTAAADRRVKNKATRAAVAILTNAGQIIPKLIARFVDIDDDEVRERVLTTTYAAMLLTRHEKMVHEAASMLSELYLAVPGNFDNAAIRDYIRCICELSIVLSPADRGVIVPETITTRRASEEWPLVMPTDDEVDQWAHAIRLWPDEFRSDFFKYSMGRLGSWTSGMPKSDMGKWIVQRVSKEFSFYGSECEQYDNRVLSTHGGGRGKPIWAERIAKKYAWIALSQLGSRLHDHVPRRLDRWEENHTGRPLILPEARQLDPTVGESPRTRPATRFDWRRTTPTDLASPSQDFDSWTSSRSVPTLVDLARAQVCGHQAFRPILAYRNWSGPEKQDEAVGAYRHMWVDLRTYLTPLEQLRKVYEALRREELWGRFLSPNPTQFFNTFAAEYPWVLAWAPNEEDDWNEFSVQGSGTSQISAMAAWNELASGWEYDVSHESGTIHVPCRQLLEPTLWWDGDGGFSGNDHKTVFYDPSFRSLGPPALLADADFIKHRLQATGLGMVFTLDGQKSVLAQGFGVPPDFPKLRFKQFGHLDGKTEGYSRLIYFTEE